MTPAPVTEPPAPWRLLLVAAMMMGLYFALAWVDDDVSVEPWRLVGAGVVGGAVGAAVARFVPPRTPRGRARPTNAAIRSSLAGLTGIALVLAQVLSAEGMVWLMLGGVALMMGGATHGWLTARRDTRPVRS